MNYTIARVSADQFAQAYGLDRCGDEHLAHVLRSMEDLRPIFRSQRTAVGQAWLDEYARVIHETSQVHRADPVIFTCDAGEFARWAREQ